MFTYRVRRRVFRHEPGSEITFPNRTVTRFHFLPKQPFGAEPGGGHTAVRAVAATSYFDANTGQHYIESNQPLAPLQVRIEAPTRTVELQGTVLTVTEDHEILGSLHHTIESLYFVLPTLLAVPFADPPIVERVEGTIGGIPFRWELAEWKGTYRTTTQESQQRAIVEALGRLSLLADPARRRITAALHYFHVARRLLAVAALPGEFLSEAILNLAKVLEVLFPASGTTGTIDAARAGLTSLGYDQAAIEAKFVPALALRNRIDVGHVDLTLFTLDQLTVFHAYAEASEGHFRDLLATVLQRLETDTLTLEPIPLSEPEPEDLRIISRIQEALQPGAT